MKIRQFIFISVLVLSSCKNGEVNSNASDSSEEDSGITGVPVEIVAIAGDSSAVIDFTPPVGGGAEKIAKYKVESMPETVTTISASSPITVTGLSNGISYCFKVTALDKKDKGGPNALSNCITPRARQNVIKSVSAGGNHTCVIVDESLKCFGSNEHGQIGNGSIGFSVLTPFTVFESGVTAVSAGTFHTCAIHFGKLKCWGFNENGQVGNGVYGYNADVTTPFTVFDVGVSAVSAGWSQTCVIHFGALKCFGGNNYGQVGNELLESAIVTPNLIFENGVTTITTGYYHTCAIVNNSLRCFGNNDQGEVGNGFNNGFILNPYTVFTSGVSAVSAGNRHTCAIENGSLKCFGMNENGQIGNGSTSENVLIPYLVFEKDVSAVSAGGVHTCAIVNHSLKCFGDNNHGQLGNGLFFANYNITSPYTVFESGVTAISLGGHHTCAIVDGSLRCFGANFFGQIGNGSTGSSVPSPFIFTSF